MDREHSTAPPAGTDPREFALQLAVIAQRLDERSAFAVERVEAVGASLQQEAANAARFLAGERQRIADDGRAAVASRLRLLRIASAALFAGALFALAGAALALHSARRELASLQRDGALLGAIERADLVLCGERLCARVEGATTGDDGYRPVAARSVPGSAP